MTRATGELPRTRVYVATTEGAVLVQRIVAEDALAEGEPSAVCLNGTTTRLPITKAYTDFIHDHVRGIAGRAAFRLDLDQRIDGGSSWMLGVWIAHLLLVQGRLAMQDEAAETAVFATGEVAFGASAERHTEIRAIGHIAEKIEQLAERAAAEAAAGRRVLLFVPVANLPEAQDAFTRLSAAVREKVVFCPVDSISDVRARLEVEAGAALPVRDSTIQDPTARDPTVRAADRKHGSGPRTTNADARDGPAGAPSRSRSGWGEWVKWALIPCLLALAGSYLPWLIDYLKPTPHYEHKPGSKFRDCMECPQLVVVPEGMYMMGSPRDEKDREDHEGPRHEVRIAKAFAVGVNEVTFEEWDACVKGGGCEGYRPDDKGWGRGARPVINVSWKNAQAYVGWLRRKTEEEYRLLSESEWEYVARAGTDTPYSWGDSIGENRANCEGCGDGWRNKTEPMMSFEANGFGVYDMHGNVLEWVQDCWNDSYRGAPADGSAWESGKCVRRVVRGGSWDNAPEFLRSASRGWSYGGRKQIGFRVARTLTP